MCSPSIRGMNRSMDLSEQLTEDYWRRVREKEEMKKQYTFAKEVLDVLQEADPDGWEAWFDAHITDETTLEEAVELMRKRILDVYGGKMSVKNTFDQVEMFGILAKLWVREGDPATPDVFEAVFHANMLADLEGGQR